MGLKYWINDGGTPKRKCKAFAIFQGTQIRNVFAQTVDVSDGGATSVVPQDDVSCLSEAIFAPKSNNASAAATPAGEMITFSLPVCCRWLIKPAANFTCAAAVRSCGSICACALKPCANKMPAAVAIKPKILKKFRVTAAGYDLIGIL
jgi:hypothetical protein